MNTIPRPQVPVLEPNRKSNKKPLHAADTQTKLKAEVDPAKLTPLPSRPSDDVVQLQREIAEIIPAGNVIGLILSSLGQLKDRALPTGTAGRDVASLMRGLEWMQRVAFNAAVFASPAAVLSAYQQMLSFAGKDMQSAFPEGMWQFYLEFAMREDTAHHTIETVGFQRGLEQHRFHLSLYDQLTAWAMAVLNLYFQYDDLLFVEWSESVYLSLLEKEVIAAERTKDAFFQNLRKKWSRQKPYRRDHDAEHDETYVVYRQRRFQRFCQPRLQSLPAASRQAIEQKYQQLLKTDAPAFQHQLSILATLNPERYREIRTTIPLWQARLAIIWQNQYHLIPACAVNDQGAPFCFDLEDDHLSPIAMVVDEQGGLRHPRYGPVRVQQNGLVVNLKNNKSVGRLHPLPFHQLQYWVWAIINNQYLSNTAVTRFDVALLETLRAQQQKRRNKLDAVDKANLDVLKMVPIIINWDQRDAQQPLAMARLGRRGIGDGAFTLFRTQSSMIFDLSHVFFDGRWGMALAEILTSEALAWAAYLANSPTLQAVTTITSPIDYTLKRVIPEASAEAHNADLAAMQTLRKNLVQRSREDIIFTVNDLLILYRTLFNREYTPAPFLLQKLEEASQDCSSAVQAIKTYLAKLPETNPTLLIPMASVDGPPKDRIYPISFRNPFPKFLDLFYQTYNVLCSYQHSPTSVLWKQFSRERHKLVDEIYYFGQLMQHHRTLTSTGQSTNIATLRLLGHLPEAMQSMLDKIPQNFDFLNEMLKGDEVFSNLGRVARNTSPVRFMSASDDNNAKSLVWGVVTDDADVMHISMRDFRPEVVCLFDQGHTPLAQLLAQDFLNGYVEGLNGFTKKLNDIVVATPGTLQ